MNTRCVRVSSALSLILRGHHVILIDKHAEDKPPGPEPTTTETGCLEMGGLGVVAGAAEAFRAVFTTSSATLTSVAIGKPSLILMY